MISTEGIITLIASIILFFALFVARNKEKIYVLPIRPRRNLVILDHLFCPDSNNNHPLWSCDLGDTTNMKIGLPYSGCSQKHISQFFSSSHKAMDFCFTGCFGTFLCAPNPCEVEKIVTDQTIDNDYYPAFEKGYGILLRDMTNRDITYLYWHCQQVFPVKVGQNVGKGEAVAQIGNSGYCVSGGIEVPLKNRGTKGAHLHLEVRKNGVQVNPFDYFDWNDQPKFDVLKTISQFLTRMSNLLTGKK